MRIFIIILIVFVFRFVSIAQDPNFYVLGEKQFANTNIYTLLYDDNTDILYAGTNEGMYAYRHNTFEKLKVVGSQTPSVFFQLKKGKNDEIFCVAIDGRIFKIEDFKIKLFTKITKQYLVNNFNYSVANNGDLIVTTKELIKVDAKGKQEILLNGGVNYMSLMKAWNDEIFILYKNDVKGELYSYKNNSLKLVADSIDYLNSNVLIDDIYACYFTHKNIAFNIENEKCFNCSYKIGERISKESPLRSIRFIKKDEVIAMSKTNGAKILTLKNDSLVLKQHLFQNEFLSAETQNKNGTFFFGTFGGGIKVVPNIKVVSTVSSELFLGIASSPDGNVTISTRSGKLLNANNMKTIATHSTNIDNVFYAKGFLKDDFISQHNIIFLSSLKDVYTIDSNLLLISGSNGIGVLSKDNAHPLLANLEYFSERLPNKYQIFETVQRTSSVGFSKEDTLIYYNTNHGVFSKKWSKDIRNEILYKGKSFWANDIINYKNSLIFATGANGILFYSKHKFVKTITAKEGLYSNNIHKIIEKNNRLYILSKNGFQIYNLETNIFEQMNDANGVNQENVTNFTVSNNKIHFIEKHKYYTISDKTENVENKVLTLYFEGINVNTKKISLKENDFKSKENKFEFLFDYRDIETKPETKIWYKLEGFDKDWKKISNSENNVLYQSLPAGTYTFNIKAVYRTQESKTFKYKFKINPPFWQQWWFYLFIIAISGFIVYFISFKKMKNKEIENKVKLEKEILKKELAQSNLKTLRAQMNPHFIFNALNSVQDLVLLKDIRNSNKYLGKFSDLIRKILLSSRQQFISLEEEIEMLTLYLDLEKLRFGDEFEVNLICNVCQESQDKIQIPAMFIQPYVENAIKHGLFYKVGKKELLIRFTLNENILKCIVKDNGIGQKKAEEMKQKRHHLHTGFSTDAINKRIRLLNETLNQNIELNIEDLFENNIAVGTKITLLFPV